MSGGPIRFLDRMYTGDDSKMYNIRCPTVATVFELRCTTARATGDLHFVRTGCYSEETGLQCEMRRSYEERFDALCRRAKIR